MKSSILNMLNKYLVARDIEKQAKEQKHSLRDALLKALPPNKDNEWAIYPWGRVTYQRPQDSLVVDMERLERLFPKAYAACVRSEPNSPRFCVYPEAATLAAVFSKQESKTA